MRGEKYDLNKSPLHIDIECSSGNILTFFFSTFVRKRSFDRRYRAYRDQVRNVINSRYRGIALESDELALIDLYSRIETDARRIEIIDVFGVKRSLDVKSTIAIKAIIR